MEQGDKKSDRKRDYKSQTNQEASEVKVKLSRQVKTHVIGSFPKSEYVFSILLALLLTLLTSRLYKFWAGRYYVVECRVTEQVAKHWVDNYNRSVSDLNIEKCLSSEYTYHSTSNQTLLWSV